MRNGIIVCVVIVALAAVTVIARPFPCEENCADLNGSGGIIDTLDFNTFNICFNARVVTPGCACSDLNLDGVVNLVDLNTFSILFGLPVKPLSPPDCLLPVGGCCHEDGNGNPMCDILAEADCLIRPNGSYQGDGTTCGEPRACCMPDGGCENLDPVCCELAGGTPDSLPTLCGNEEGCCLADGGCLDMTPRCCLAVGGTGGSILGCSPAEACCLGDGACTEMDPVCCFGTGGLAVGEDTICELPQACEFGDGSCADLDVQCCLDQGGIPQGDGTECIPLETPLPKRRTR
jgi:hypothetical protein